MPIQIVVPVLRVVELDNGLWGVMLLVDGQQHETVLLGAGRTRQIAIDRAQLFSEHLLTAAHLLR